MEDANGYSENFQRGAESLRKQAAEFAEYKRTKALRDQEAAEVVKLLEAEWKKYLPAETAPKGPQWALWLARYTAIEVERAVLIAASHFSRNPDKVSHEAAGRYVSAVLRNWARD